MSPLGTSRCPLMLRFMLALENFGPTALRGGDASGTSQRACEGYSSVATWNGAFNSVVVSLAVVTTDLSVPLAGSTVRIVLVGLAAEAPRQFLGDAPASRPRPHLLPDTRGLDAGATPQHDEVVEQVRALPHHASIVVLDCFQGNLASLFNDLLRDLACAGLKQLESAWIARRRYFAERNVDGYLLLSAALG